MTWLNHSAIASFCNRFEAKLKHFSEDEIDAPNLAVYLAEWLATLVESDQTGESLRLVAQLMNGAHSCLAPLAHSQIALHTLRTLLDQLVCFIDSLIPNCSLQESLGFFLFCSQFRIHFFMFGEIRF